MYLNDIQQFNQYVNKSKYRTIYKTNLQSICNITIDAAL